MRILGGRYRLEQRIGVGGMSEVWRGFDQVLARPVAVKLLNPDRSADRDCDEQARTEARSAAQLIHPNVAGVYDVGMAALPELAQGRQAPYIVMELVHGATLAEHLTTGPMVWDIAVRVCAEVSAALAAAHGRGIVHRDIKPANIMLTPSGVKVLDFGIATAAGQRDQLPEGTVLGTPAYLAPERLDGAPATPATDMYAVGVLLYQCLTGRLPWPADTPTALYYAHRNSRPDPLPPIDGLAPEAADLCARCLTDDPEERPTSALAALVLAEAVDARVYVPPVGVPRVPDPRPAGESRARESRAVENRARESRAVENRAGEDRAGESGPASPKHRGPTRDVSADAATSAGRHRAPAQPPSWAAHPTEAARPGRRRG
ncbi:serine/threonine-protein kinase [Planosporangium thailandense]|uniref:serine/threonine-protein kinase n=1 Tax=Planosporangium thailandense TaxID=765197 RepID=UPI0030B841F6